MIKAILYKEWIKTQRTILLSALTFAVALCYVFICVGQTIRIEGVKSLILSYINHNSNVVNILTFIPTLAGTVIGISQFVGEMTDKRLKLTLHLPVSEWKMLLTMLGFGTGIMIAFSLITIAILGVGLRIVVPYEIVEDNILTTIPWLLAGISAYLLTAWICIEPTWKGRAINSIIALIFISLFVINSSTGVMITMIPYLLAMTAIAALFPCLSVARFKDGKM